MQTPVEYHTVFAVLQTTAPSWLEFFIVPIIVIVASTVAGAASIVLRKVRSFLVIAVFAVLLMLAAYFPFNYSDVRDMYDSTKNAYAEGRYSMIEGTVTDFHPMPYSGHQEETFSVNGVHFSYSDFITVPCFNNTTSHGGPIREGLRVRIAYSGNCILKLELATNR